MAEILFETLAKIDRLDSERVRQIVESNKTSSQSLRELVLHDTFEKNRYTLFAEKLEREVIPHTGDIVVGFFAKGKITFEISCAQHDVQQVSLWKNEFTYALFDAFPILMICTRYHETRVKVISGDKNDLYVLYAFLDCDNRRFMARNQFCTECYGYENTSSKRYMGYSSGMYHFFDSKPNWYYELKPWIQDPDVEEMKRRAKDRTYTLMKDFAESTWRPGRFMHWCLPFDELPEDVFPIVPIAKHFTKLYMDDVILIEYAITTMKDIDPFLKSQGLTRVGDFHRIVYTQDGGLAIHKDNPLQGGEVSAVFYLNDADGGHIVFPSSGVRVLPKKGRCLIFDVNVSHYVEPIAFGTKEVMTCECVYTRH